MKIIDKLLDLIREYKWLLFSVLFYFSFQDSILGYFQKYIVDKIFVKFSSSWITEFAFYIVATLVVIWAINKFIRGFYFKSNTIIYSLFGIAFYSYIRILFETELRSLELKNIKYFDIIYVVLGTMVILHAILKLKKKKKGFKDAIPFYDDNPIESSSKDILNRKERALQVARFIKSNHSNLSIAVGVVGKWGDGKTSFMCMIEESFADNNEYITIKFKSWLNISVNSIFSDFFNTVEKEIRPYSVDVAKEVKKYGKSVLSLYKNTTTELLLNSLDLISDRSVSEDFENVDSLLTKLGKKIIVFLDDLDRLQPNEIFEVLKLIRNTASFKTFNYIVGYDKDYLIEALETNKIPNAQKYCDKIFINEYFLLPIRNTEINNYIKLNIQEIFKDENEDFDRIFERYSIYSQHKLGEVFGSIKNLRDAKRFLNEFHISYIKVKDEVDIGDFLIIKLIKFSYNDVYFLLYSNRNKFIGNDDRSAYRYSGGIRRIALRKDDKTSSDFNESILKKYLVENSLYNNQELEHLQELFQILFLEYYKDSLAFGYNHNFYKYFKDEIDDSEISAKEYKTAINSDWGILMDYVNEWDRKGKIFGLSAHLYHTEIRDFESKGKFENYFKLLFLVGRLEVERNTSNYFHIDFDYINTCLSDYENKISNKYYNGNKENYKNFLKDLLYGAEFPYTFDVRLCKYLYDRIFSGEEGLILTKENLKNYIVYQFKNFAEKMDYLQDDFFGAFHRSVLPENYQKDVNSDLWYKRDVVPREIKEISKDIIKKFPDNFLVDILDNGGWRNFDINGNPIIGINKFVLYIFKSYEVFIDFIRNEIDDDVSVFKKEFLEYADALSNKNDYISYDFQYIPVKNKFLKIKNRVIE